MSEKLYVLGFAFNAEADHVVLVHKERPEWQKGLINGVGGKVEDFDAEYANGMSREFKEETGVFIAEPDWEHFATMHFGEDELGAEAFVFCFRTFTNGIYQCKTKESEKIEIFEVGDQYKGFKTLKGLKLINHIKTLIPMAQDRSFKFADIKMK